MTFLAHIDGRRYAVADDAIGAVKDSIIRAVRGGGDVIDIPIVTGAVVKVLTTSTSKARIELVPEPIDDDGDGDRFLNTAFYDLDM
jgi:hypothetical protein